MKQANLQPTSGAGKALTAWRANVALLLAVVWLSSTVFGVYILSFFGGTTFRGQGAQWNGSLPDLYDPPHLMATIAIGLHMAAGAVLLVLGPVQLIGAVRQRSPGLHRWLGRIYICCAILAGGGGLAYILTRRTIGGLQMDLGFAAYGALLVLAAAQTYHHGRAGRHEDHRAWAIRLFALTIGSWLYRMEYGLWFALVGQIGHARDFSGWFDYVMDVFFYVPNLVVAELIIRGPRSGLAALLAFGCIVVFGVTCFLMVATWTFTKLYWASGIAQGLLGR